MGVLLVLAVGTFTVGTDGFVLNGLLPSIARDLNVSESTAGQLTTIFAITYAIASPLIAAATGDWDRRRLLGGGLVLFTIGMAGQALGTTYAVVAVSRVLAAVGAAAFQSNAYVVAGALATDDRRGRALATVSAGMSTSAVLGVPIGVLAGQGLGWRPVMWAIGVAGVLVAVAIPLLPAVHVPPVRLRARLSVLIRPAVAKVLVVTVVGAVATFAVFVYLPLIVAPSATGAALSWVLVALGAGQVAGNSLAGRWTDRFGPGPVRLLSLGGSVVTCAILNVAAPSLPGVLLLALVSGAAGGMLMVPQQHRLFSVAPDAPTVALGLNGSAIYLGGGLGSAAGGAVLATAGVDWLAPAGALLAAIALTLACVYRAAAVQPAR
ncbi:MFS transporter [Amycolatopsis anabasis]|uniref:MFS transporter n=1 Tax=Amycolatopsis anabasis TaxID=1840409 RepID=UPI001FE78A83|nr:MFS transporter [Amycolatopsis anabasis]